MKVVVTAFNQEKALVGAFSVITNLRMQLFEALAHRTYWGHTLAIHQHVDTTIPAYNIQPHHTFTPSPLAIGDDEWSNIVVIVPI